MPFVYPLQGDTSSGYLHPQVGGILLTTADLLSLPLPIDYNTVASGAAGAGGCSVGVGVGLNPRQGYRPSRISHFHSSLYLLAELGPQQPNDQVQRLELVPCVRVLEIRALSVGLQASMFVSVQQAVEVEARCSLVLGPQDGLGVASPTLLLPPGQVHTDQDNRSTDDLLDPESLPKEDDPGGHAHHGDQILVDQNPVRPDAADPALPPGEGEGRSEERREDHRRPRTNPDARPLQVKEVRRRQNQQERGSEDDRVACHRQGCMTLQ